MTTSCTFCSKHKVLHISTLICPNDMKLSWLLPHEPLRLCEKKINLLFLTPPKPFDRFAKNSASRICGQNLPNPFTYVTPGGGPFWCFTIKPSTHYNFYIQFAIYSKLLKHVEGLALNTSTWHNLMRMDCEVPFITACRFNLLYFPFWASVFSVWCIQKNATLTCFFVC